MKQFELIRDQAKKMPATFYYGVHFLYTVPKNVEPRKKIELSVLPKTQPDPQ